MDSCQDDRGRFFINDSPVSLYNFGQILEKISNMWDKYAMDMRGYHFFDT